MFHLDTQRLAFRSSSSHERVAVLALDALQPGDTAWRDLLLLHHDHYLAGVRSGPQRERRNGTRVHLVGQGAWGGLSEAATIAYADAVALLRARHWVEAAKALGRLSYYHDLCFNPLHTVQSETASTLRYLAQARRSDSWSQIEARIEDHGYQSVTVDGRPGFVSQLVQAGAAKANGKVDTVVALLTAKASQASEPVDRLVDMFAELAACSIAGSAALFGQAFRDSGRSAPSTRLALAGVLAGLDGPRYWLARQLMASQRNRRVRAIEAEIAQSGKARKSIPRADRILRAVHARQLLRLTLAELDRQVEVKGPERASEALEAETGSVIISPTQGANDRPERFDPVAIDTLDLDDAFHTDDDSSDTGTDDLDQGEDVLDDAGLDFPQPEARLPAAIVARLREQTADEIEAEELEREEYELSFMSNEDEDDREWTPECLERNATLYDALLLDDDTAKLLSDAGIDTVEDLLLVDAAELLDYVDSDEITAEMVTDWQAQVELMMTVAGLRPLDTEVLIAAGIRSADALAKASADEVFSAAMDYLDAEFGEDLSNEDEAEIEKADVEGWIDFARSHPSRRTLG